MSLAKIEISHLRNIGSATLTPSPELNVLAGPNGSGKTSALEAVYLLGRGRSFRTAQARHLIQLEHKEAIVSGVVQHGGRLEIPIGVRLTRSEREIRLHGKAAQSAAELARAFPVQLIQPPSMSLLEGSPQSRRQFLDWGTFHVEPRYLDQWHRFAKALSQRNAVLKQGRPAALDPWNQELAQYGTILAEMRERYLASLAPYVRETAAAFFGGRAIDLTHARGWTNGRALLDALREDAPEDFRHGFTRWGPHRGDFSISVDGVPAKLYLSRGQVKLLVYALLLAQVTLAETTAGSVCLLIDDLASELDGDNRRRLIDLLLRRRVQSFVTALHPEDIGCPLAGGAKMFHVEHGRITEM